MWCTNYCQSLPIEVNAKIGNVWDTHTCKEHDMLQSRKTLSLYNNEQTYITVFNAKQAPFPTVTITRIFRFFCNVRIIECRKKRLFGVHIQCFFSTKYNCHQLQAREKTTWNRSSMLIYYGIHEDTNHEYSHSKTWIFKQGDSTNEWRDMQLFTVKGQ